MKTRNKRTHKLFILILPVFISLAVLGQAPISIKPIDLTKLPKEINYEGEIKTAVHWDYSLGDNIAILTETGIYQNKTFKHENEGGDCYEF